MQSVMQARQIIIKGLVQGVGFRPYVYNLARKFELNGWVRNTCEGLCIQLEGDDGQMDDFVRELLAHPPKASSIYSVQQSESDSRDTTRFRIRSSRTESEQITQISPDIAVCDDCIQDMKSQPHRLAYPFVNCTHCGPRFTIIRELPYDRNRTTMDPFIMCDTCRSEYENMEDRRFHAQPVACNICGPEYTLICSEKQIKNIHEILKYCRTILENSGIVAIKGLGGYHLMCNAADEVAVAKLRNAKKRNGKPFAVMVRDLEAARMVSEISEYEAELLTSWRRPIVLLKQRKILADSINLGLGTIGLMLPYMPFHQLMFESFDPGRLSAIVMTSGNRLDEPIVTDNAKALETFRDMADAVLTYNRDICNQTDDSVVFVARGKRRSIRRSRGYVPDPVRLSFPVDGILAVGAELNHTFAVGKGNEVLMSQHMGDLKDPETYTFFRETVSRFNEMFRMKPAYVACDLHPDYLSSRFAGELSLPVVKIQHHHAHVAACMAEFNLNEPVIGVCWDGTGLGSDGHIWGGEFLYADLFSFTRHTHFDYVPLPGGDLAARDTWRTGISVLYQTFGKDFLKLDLPFVRDMYLKPELSLILHAIDRQLNTPLTSSAGRLFDAVAAITKVCSQNSFHAEAPMKLESIADENVQEEYSVDIGEAISFRPMFRELVSDIQNRVPASVISAKFHNTLVSVIVSVTTDMKNTFKTDKVVLTGGVFQNRFLLEKTEKCLENGFQVYSPELIPCNDAGIALGQMAVAAQKIGINPTSSS